MSRFLRVRIYNSSNTIVEYDNKPAGTATPNLGIDTGTAILDRVIMPDEIKFGEMYPSMFQVTIFGLPTNVNLKGRKIMVTMYYDQTSVDKLVDSNSNYIVNEESEGIALNSSTTSTYKTLFIGYIQNSDTDIIKTDRVITAYDRAYTLRNTDIASWWNTYWASNTSGVTLATFRNALLTSLSLGTITGGFINDSAIIKNPFQNNVTSLMFGTVIKAICQLQCTCPYIDGTGFFRVLNLGLLAKNISNNLEGLNSKWEDYTTEAITGVGVYDTSEELAQLVGTADNVYKIVGNMFLLNMSATAITTVCTNIKNELSGIVYTPCELNLVESDFTHNLGDKISTPNGYAYIMEQTFSGSLLINENIKSPAIGPNLNNSKVEDVNDELVDSMKFSKINHTIDEFSSEIYDPLTGESRIDQLSNKIVLKVATDGSIVQVDLGVDPDDQSASIFQVDADNISFISNNKIMLTANSLEIDSTNFSVDSAGNVTATNLIATGGTIGGWTISANDLHIGNYARMTKAGFTASNGGDTKYTTYGAEYITAGTNVPSTQSVLNLFNVTDNTTAIGKELSKIFDKKYIKAGTVVKTIAHANPVAVFTSTEINTLMNMTGASAGSVTVFVMNGDANAQAANVVMTYWQGSTVYAEFDTAPSAGSYRFNYIIVRF